MSVDFQIQLEKYIDVILKIGLNLQPGQRLLIGNPTSPAPFEAAEVVRLVAEKAYRLGCPLVEPLFGDDRLTLARIQNAAPETLENFPAWQIEGYLAEINAGAALLAIYARDPDLLSGQDPERVGAMMQAAVRQSKPLGDLVGVNACNWLVIAVPTTGWAKRVFPDLPVEAAKQRLWELIFAATRVDQPDPIAAWETHLHKLAERKDALTRKGYAALHYRAPGTDLTVGLPRGHVWMGGREDTKYGLPFCANLPTEEVYTLPHRDRVDGVVAATRSFSYVGGSIEGARLTFTGGRVTDYSAERNAELLGKVLETDEGARRLGEVALVPHSSPISRTGQIFQNILFDENAACHFAFGDSYRTCLEGGPGFSDDDYQAAGGNSSAVHLDFMIGSGELDIDGICDDGTREAVMRAGEWVE